MSVAARPEHDRPNAGSDDDTGITATSAAEVTQRHVWIPEVAWASAVSVLSVGVALLVYRVWNANLHLSLGYSYDSRLVAMTVKGLRENGWWIHNPRLGAPFGQDMRDFPFSGQTTQLAVLRVMTLFVRSPGLTINLYFFGGFAAVAAVGYAVFRRLGLSRPVAAGLAVAYDFLPFHYWHGPDHLMHSAYFTAPLALLLLVRVFEPEPRFVDGARPLRPFFGPDGSIRVRAFVLLIALAVFIGVTEEMIAVFTVVMLATGGLVVAIGTRRLRRLGYAAIFAAAIVLAFALVSLPTILHVLEHGRDRVAARRYTFETDLYGLRLAFMLLPTPTHWIHALGTFSRRILVQNSMPSEPGQAIGTIGTVGTFAALGFMLARGWRADAEPSPRTRRPLPAIVGPLVLVVVLGTILGLGGATFLDALSGFAQIRTWNWVLLLIAFAAFVLTGLLCEHLLGALRARDGNGRRATAATVAVGVLLAGLGILDGGQPPRPNEQLTTDKYVADRAFDVAMQRVQPPDGMIFQLPVIRFPESLPVVRMVDYEELRPYLADTGHLRWSYGAVKGRPGADWQLRVPAIPTTADLRALVGMRFTGLWVDRDGYRDNARALESALRATLGAPIVNTNNRRLFWDLRPFASRIPPGSDLAAEAHARFGVDPPRR